MSLAPLDYDQLTQTARICELDNQGTLRFGSVFQEDYTFYIQWEHHETPERISRYNLSADRPLYNAADPRISLALEWVPQIIMIKSLNYRADLLLQYPQLLPILQQIQQIIGEETLQGIGRTYQSMGSMSNTRRLFETCLKHLRDPEVS